MNNPRFLRIPKGQAGAGRFAKKYAAPIPAPRAPVAPPVPVKMGSNDEEYANILIKHLRDKTNNATSVGTCSYGMIGRNKAVYVHVRDVCHARMYANADMGCVAAAEVLSKNENNYVMQIDFLTFMATQSPFKQCFITKDGKQMVDHGIVYDVQQPKSHVVAAAIAIRLIHEHKDALNAWKLVRSLDVPAGLKYVVLYFTTGMGTFTDNRTHTAFSGCISMDGMEKFAIHGELGDWKEPTFFESRGRYEIYRVFNANNKNQYGGVEDAKTIGGFLRKHKNAVNGAHKFGQTDKQVFDYKQMVNLLIGALK